MIILAILSFGVCALAEGAANAYVDAVALEADVEQEALLLTGEHAAAMPDSFTPSHPGTLVAENKKAVIDYSNTQDGYVMVCYTADTSKRLKVQVKGPRTTYTYNITKGEWAVLPLTDGNGKYQVKVYRQTSGNSYTSVIAAKHKVQLSDEFAPFLRPNQYVDYNAASNMVAVAHELTRDIEHPLGKVEAIYNYVVTNLSYDKQKAKTVKSGYLPVLDEILESQKGICFDYASLMTGMLRSQGVPCKMVFGYAGKAYHAWISVWSQDTGWVDGVIFFDGTNWQRLDPTFASSADQSEAIMKYIGNGKNYKEKYFY